MLQILAMFYTDSVSLKCLVHHWKLKHFVDIFVELISLEKLIQVYRNFLVTDCIVGLVNKFHKKTKICKRILQCF